MASDYEIETDRLSWFARFHKALAAAPADRIIRCVDLGTNRGDASDYIGWWEPYLDEDGVQDGWVKDGRWL